MKFPSVKYLATQSVTTFTRFYLPLLFAFMGAIVSVMQIEHYNPASNRLIFTCSIGLSLSLGCALLAERLSKPWHMAATAFSLVAATAYWLWLAPTEFLRGFIPTIAYVVLVVVVHLFVAVAPYLGRNEATGFWRYNETLFARMLLSGVFSATLFVGLAVAIGACDILFKLHIDYKIYPKLWILVVGIFNTWFFLAGIPSEYAPLNTEKLFPRFLKIFTQYILIPIVTLYMVILYAYSIRILVAWSLPHGWVSMLILWYSVAGILAVLLVTPLRDDKDTPWVRFFSRLFFIATLPLIVLLYVAIMARVGDYGITEPRYYLLLIGSWLGGISLYFIFSQKKNIKVIPASLGVIGLLSLAGPWSAFSVSERSQLHRLQAILIKNKVWKPGQKIAGKPVGIPPDDAQQVRSIVRYLVDRERAKTLQPFVTANVDTLIADAHYSSHGAGTITASDREIKNNLEEKLMPLFCANDLSGKLHHAPNYYFETDRSKGIDIGGYSKAFNISLGNGDHATENIVLSAGNSIEVSITEKNDFTNIVLKRSDTTVETISLNALVKKLRAHPNDDYRTMNTQELTIDGTGVLKPRIIIRSIRLSDPGRDHELIKVYHLEASILIR